MEKHKNRLLKICAEIDEQKILKNAKTLHKAKNKYVSCVTKVNTLASLKKTYIYIYISLKKLKGKLLKICAESDEKKIMQKYQNTA